MSTFVMPIPFHNDLVSSAFQSRGFNKTESDTTARFCEMASAHGIKTHNAIKALHLDHHFGSGAGGCVPNANIEKIPSKYKAVEKWNANKKIGPATAFDAMDTCMKLADEFGVGVVTVDNAFHYLWGGGYVIDAARKGYIAYTCCTAALAEVVPFGGRTPTLGTNPHSWAFPTTEAIGYPICIDWATSTIAMGRVQVLAREGKPIPPGAAVDKDGKETTDPAKVAALIPFGAHKGYGLSLIDELLAAYTGGSLATLRSRWTQGAKDEKHTPSFFFQCIRADALDCGDFAQRRSQSQNIKAVIEDILGPGNEKCLLPGQIEAAAYAESKKHNGLLLTQAEVDAFAQIAEEAKLPFDRSILKTIE